MGQSSNIYWRWGIIIAIICCALAFFSYLHPSWEGKPLEFTPGEGKKILLVPLDGRPPCRDFVINVGKIGGYAVTVPPSQLQDFYSLPGEVPEMRRWVLENAPECHALILSVDQLLYGGLLAAREKTATAEEIAALLDFFRKLRQENPTLPIYAFGVLPRLTPQDTIDGYYEKRRLMEYSRLMGQKEAGLSVDEGKLHELAVGITPESMSAYLTHFTAATELNRQLALLTREGVIDKLVLGQDDGERYSIPNSEKEKLKDFIKNENLNAVTVTHGADELALLMLAEFKLKERGYRPKVWVEYAAEAMAERVMPYMAVSLRENTAETLNLLGSVAAASPQEADFALYISAVDRYQNELKSRRQSVKRLEELRKARIPTALVDLSKHYVEEETVFPLLVRSAFPVNSLIAYAGWNTASNSLGTALAEATLFTAARREAKTKEDVLALYQANLTFLQNRFLEDSLYLKDVIDRVNRALKKAGYANTADLDLEHNYRYANILLRQGMAERLPSYLASKAFRAPLEIEIPGGTAKIAVKSLRAAMSYPWPRTFEIRLESNLELVQYP